MNESKSQTRLSWLSHEEHLHETEKELVDEAVIMIESFKNIEPKTLLWRYKKYSKMQMLKKLMYMAVAL